MNKKLKKIPYGLSDFARIREENFYYVDKTAFIEKIEDSSLYLFFIRPRRFGKSLFLSLMENYYDIAKKDSFEKLFKGTYIYDNPTDEQNKYFILKFNFSEVSSDINEVRSSFNQTIKSDCLDFIQKYGEYLKDNDGDMYKTIKNSQEASSTLKYLIAFTRGKGKIYLLIDEYDNFTDTIISSTGHEQYMAITHGEGFYRHFFNVIKAGTTGGPIAKLFITGVSPVTMDDVTSGFNIGYNITSEPDFNEMVGFTEEEIMSLLKHYNIGKPDNLINIMKKWYNNYLFSEDEKIRMYNSDMVLYFTEKYLQTGKIPKDMLDYNIRTDYNKLKYLIAVDMEGKHRLNGNFEKLKIILEDGQIKANIVSSFPVNRVTDPENFISLLYYFGLLTIKDVKRGMTELTIPNEVIRQLYYEYLREGYRDTKVFNIDLYKLGQLFNNLAYEGNWKDLFVYLTSEMNKQTSVRDYIEGERSIQTFFRAYLNVSNYYITRTEFELNKGYCDILLLPNLLQFPDIEYSYLIEMKYIKPSEYNQTKLEEKIKDAREKLNKYKNDESLKTFTGNTNIINLIFVFSGIELKYIDINA
jgi:hypothetical protein